MGAVFAQIVCAARTCHASSPACSLEASAITAAAESSSHPYILPNLKFAVRTRILMVECCVCHASAGSGCLPATHGPAVRAGQQMRAVISHVSASVSASAVLPPHSLFGSFCHAMECARYYVSRYGTADAVVPSALSVQVYEAWRAAAAAEAACGSAELRTLCFEHDGGHFLPASKQVISALVLDACCCCSV
jgi:hypothetical protein